MKITFVLIAIIALVSCSENPGDNCSCDPQVIAKNDSLIKKEFSDTLAMNEYFRKWSVPPIQSYNNESYRLRSTHTLHDYSHMYTIVKKESGTSLNVREYDSSLMITKEYNVHVTNDEWEKIKYEVESNCFWSTRILMWRGPLKGNGTWIIEGYDPKGDNCAGVKYHYAITDYNTEWDFGNIGRKIKQYAEEEKLILHQ